MLVSRLGGESLARWSCSQRARKLIKDVIERGQGPRGNANLFRVTAWAAALRHVREVLLKLGELVEIGMAACDA